jgi:hypothetical protein
MKNANKKDAASDKAVTGAQPEKASASSGKGTAQAEKAGAGKGPMLPSIKISERDRQAGFALLALLAVALVAYAVFLSPPADTPSDMDTFVGRVLGAPSVSLFFDMRDTPPSDVSRIYQCGVDIAGGKLFGSKTVTTYACDDKGCISANSASNGSSTLTYEQVQKKLSGSPYILVKGGAPSTKFFLNHAEITVDSSFTASCKLG